MATSTLNKDFTLPEKEEKHFCDVMQKPAKTVLDKNFMSAMASEEKYRSALSRALNKK